MIGAGRFFLTTPIFYVNAGPHVGHLYTALLADAQRRFQNLRGRETFLSTGTDEHGKKVSDAAQKQGGQKPEVYCEHVSQSFRNVFQRCDVQFHDYIRTTEERHQQVVRDLWLKIQGRGFIRKADYEGWYCVSDETFVAESQVQETMQAGKKVRVSSESGNPVEWANEENYLFDLGHFRKDIKHWLNDGDVVQPKTFRNQLDTFLGEKDGHDSLSVSRCRKRLPWGIPVPGDPTQVVYVWLDALANYLTVSGYPADLSEKGIWPPDVQIVGKDILKFHAFYWPAFLMAADIRPLPRKILCHSHWMVEHKKMSKSKGNVIDPNDLIERFTSDGVRYVLLREGVPSRDGNYSDSKMVNYMNSELANTLGNLLSRCTAKALNESQEFVPFDGRLWDKYTTSKSDDLRDSIEGLADKVERCYEEFNYYQGVDLIMEVLRDTNLFIQDEKPWELKKTEPERLQFVINLSLEALRVCGILLQPIIPAISSTLLNKLAVTSCSWADAKQCGWNLKKESHPLSKDKVKLFNKINK